MVKRCGAVVLCSLLLASGSYAIWVPSGHQAQDEIWYSESPGGHYPSMETQEPTYIWVEVPSLSMWVMPRSQSAPASVPEITSGETESGQVTDASAAPRRSSTVSADIEYEHSTWDTKDIALSTIDEKWNANGLQLSGRFEKSPDDRQTYGLRFHSYNTKGWQYGDDNNLLGNTGSFTLSGLYKRHLLDWLQVGGFANVTIMTGSGPSGLQIGPTLYALATPRIGPVRIWSGVTAGYAFNTFTNYIGRAHHTWPYSLVVGVGVPITRLLSMNAQVQGSHQFLDTWVTVPIRVAGQFDLIPGFKHTMLFGFDAYKSWRITLGATRPF